jgi:LPXTG-motif cell wall-anchored protein
MTNNINIAHLLSAQLLAAYSCGTYGANTYNSTCTTTGTDSNTSGNLLADTGYNVLIPLALGLALIIAAAILIIKRIRRRATQ